jgi:hypothetical protein
MDELIAMRQMTSKVVEPRADVAAVRQSELKAPRRNWIDCLSAILWRRRSPDSGRSSSLLRPLVIATAVVMIGSFVTWLLPGLLDSLDQRALHRAPVHPDRSVVKTHIVANFATPKTLIYRDLNGVRHRILVDDTEAKSFVNDTLIYLEARRNEIKADTERQINALVQSTFSDGQERFEKQQATAESS